MKDNTLIRGPHLLSLHPESRPLKLWVYKAGKKMTRVELYNLSNSLMTMYFRPLTGSAIFCFGEITVYVKSPCILILLGYSIMMKT